MFKEKTAGAIAAAGPETVVEQIDEFLENRALTQEQVCEVYNTWSRTYDLDVSKVPHGYNNPRQLTEIFAQLMAKRTTRADWHQLRILDVACGTGLVGESLRELGFQRLDGVDGSQQMLETARSKGVYENLYVEMISDRSLQFAPPRTYDAMITTGTFCPNHLQPSCLRHLAALIKPGGIVAISMRKRFYKEDPVLSKMEPELLKLQSEGLWTVLLWEEREFYYGDQPGMCFLLEVK